MDVGPSLVEQLTDLAATSLGLFTQPGEIVAWNIHMIQVQVGPDQAAWLPLILIACKSPLLGTPPLSAETPFNWVGCDQAQMNQIVQALVAQLRDAFHKIVKGAN